MKPPKLSKRLTAAVRLIERTTCLADVGCDHGKLSVYCLETAIAERVIAIDVSAPSLDKAARLAEMYQVPLDVRLGDGLSVVGEGEIETAVIAGMGGMEIARILALAPVCPLRLVLLPHKNSDVVARYLYAAGYTVDMDYVLYEDGHWYRAIRAVNRGARALGEAWKAVVDALPAEGNWYVGAQNRENPEFPLYAQERLGKLREYRQAGNRDPKLIKEIEELEKAL